MDTTRTLASLACLAALAAGARSQVEFTEIKGFTTGWQFGSTLAPAGDLDQDGTPDFLAAALGSSAHGPWTGQVYRISGKTQAVLGWELGASADAWFGQALAGGVDVNKDGWPEYMVGSPREDVNGIPQSGGVRMYSGKTNQLWFNWWGNGMDVNLGRSVGFAGDWNGDSWQDVILGAPGFPNLENVKAGSVRISSGKNGGTLAMFYGQTEDELFGFQACVIGDWDGDTIPDVAASAPSFKVNGVGVGRVDVRSGADGSTLASWTGIDSPGSFGKSLARIGDVNGDGRDDLAIGAPKSLGPGRVFVKLAGSGIEWYQVSGQDPTEMLGTSVARTGDIDKDGILDLIAGGTHSAAGGTARVYSGATGQVLWSSMEASNPGDFFGGAVIEVGDVDGDGWTELAVGSPGNDTNGTDSGAVRMVTAAHAQPDLGFGGPGNVQLEIYGQPLATGGKADLHMTGAQAGQPAFLLASAVQQPVAFKGGTIVPQVATALMFELATDTLGEITLTGISGGKGPVDVYVQILVLDAQQPQGVAFSNAVKAEFLP